MAAATDASHRPRPVADGAQDPGPSRVVPVPTPDIQMSAPSPADPMDVGSPTKTANMPPESSADPGNANGVVALNGSSPAPASAPSATGKTNPAEQPSTSDSNSMPAPPAAAAAAVHQPKIVQTAFIHKLYK